MGPGFTFHSWSARGPPLPAQANLYPPTPVSQFSKIGIGVYVSKGKATGLHVRRCPACTVLKDLFPSLSIYLGVAFFPPPPPGAAPSCWQRWPSHQFISAQCHDRDGKKAHCYSCPGISQSPPQREVAWSSGESHVIVLMFVRSFIAGISISTQTVLQPQEVVLPYWAHGMEWGRGVMERFEAKFLLLVFLGGGSGRWIPLHSKCNIRNTCT